MTNKPELPIDKITEKEFSEFKHSKLNQTVLSDEALKRIKELFGVGDRKTGYISCDEAHGHQYWCVEFYHPATGIVDRLVQEVKMYQKQLEEIKDLTRPKGI